MKKKKLHRVCLLHEHDNESNHIGQVCVVVHAINKNQAKQKTFDCHIHVNAIHHI